MRAPFKLLTKVERLKGDHTGFRYAAEIRGFKGEVMHITFTRNPFRVRQELSHGRKNRLSGYNLSHKARPVLPEHVTLKVRYVAGGKMYATQVYHPVKAAPARKAPQAGFRPAAPRTLGGMLGSLTAIEAANRLQAHKQNQGA